MFEQYMAHLLGPDWAAIVFFTPLLVMLIALVAFCIIGGISIAKDLFWSKEA